MDRIHVMSDTFTHITTPENTSRYLGGRTLRLYYGHEYINHRVKAILILKNLYKTMPNRTNAVITTEGVYKVLKLFELILLGYSYNVKTVTTNRYS
jgi:hypothetical protein